jgi:hypothetical protein
MKPSKPWSWRSRHRLNARAASALLALTFGAASPARQRSHASLLTSGLSSRNWRRLELVTRGVRIFGVDQRGHVLGSVSDRARSELDPVKVPIRGPPLDRARTYPEDGCDLIGGEERGKAVDGRH